MAGIIYALVTSYNTTTLHGLKIRALDDKVESVSLRIVAVEKDLAVRGSQFTIIIERLGKLEDKIDKIAGKR